MNLRKSRKFGLGKTFRSLYLHLHGVAENGYKWKQGQKKKFGKDNLQLREVEEAHLGVIVLLSVWRGKTELGP